MTDFQAALDKLKRSESLFQLLLENAPIPVAVVHSDTSLLFMNPAFEKRVGYSIRELFGCKPPFPWWTDATKTPEFKGVLKTGARRLTLRFKDRKNRIFWIESNVFPVEVEDGSRFYVLKWLDITERKKNEDRLLEQRRKIQQSEKKIKAFSRKLLSVREEEKKKFSQILHNEIGAMVIELGSRLTALKSRVAKGHHTAALDESDDILSLIADYGARMRKIAVDLHPPDLFENGLPQSLEKHFGSVKARFKIHIDFHVDLTCEIPDYETAVVIYRIAQEAINNVIKHARAEKAEVMLLNRPNSIVLSIRDDGIGFDRPDVLEGYANTLGITSMREMAGSLNGDFHIFSEPDKGTSIKTTIPLRGAGH